MLVFGGLTAKCIFEIDGTKPYASVYIPRLRSLGLDRAGWERLRDQLKGRLGADFDGWDQDTDEEWLLNRYLEIDGNTMRRALLSRDALVDFVTGQFQRLIPLADTVDESLKSV
jgi:hypothetical protein